MGLSVQPNYPSALLNYPSALLIRLAAGVHGVTGGLFAYPEGSLPTQVRCRTSTPCNAWEALYLPHSARRDNHVGPGGIILKAVPISEGQWRAVRAALSRTGDLFAGLVAGAPYPGALATRHWTIADTAAHVASMAWLYTSMVVDTPVQPEIAGTIAATTVDTVDQFNIVTLRIFTERDTRMLADRIRTDVAEILRATKEIDPAKPVGWLGAAKAPVAGILAHLLNEMLVHGREIARAARKAWDIPPRDAGLFLDLLVVEILRYDVGRLLDNDEPARDRRIAVDLRSAHTTPVTIVLHKGIVSVEEPGGPVDARLSFDPATLDLMLFHRISQARAVLSGKVRISGRRPWLLPRFLRTVRLP